MKKTGFIKGLLSLSLALVLVVSMGCGAFAAESDIMLISDLDDTITILYTNDVHGYIDGSLRYSLVAGYKNAIGADLLLDGGDHISGAVYGAMDSGDTLIKLMNAAGYNAASIGNHEFDYGMEGCLAAIDKADYDYLSCNFTNQKGDLMLAPYKVFEVKGTKIAVIGITTPESFLKTRPVYFQNGNGEYIYGISEGGDGKELYAAVQKAIDAASKEADIIIGLGHLGDAVSSAPWRSTDVIANTTGLDAFIDGHSHTVNASTEVADKAGNKVVLTQTGKYFANMGQMTITDGKVETKLLTADDLKALSIEPDAKVEALEDGWIGKIEKEMGTVIGSFKDNMANYDENGVRLVRKQETNTGDFCADALYYLFDSMDMKVDVAIMNGGGIRNTNTTGDITYKTCKEIHTFGNSACLQTVTGQQLLDALEFGARTVGLADNGGFLQVSGLKYTIDTTVPNTVQTDDKNNWTGGPTGSYRVSNVQVYDKASGSYKALDLKASYNLAGYNYTLKDCGDGFAMFAGSVNIADDVMEDYQVLANYVKSFKSGVVTGYEAPLGRITVKSSAFTDVKASDYFCEAAAYLAKEGIMSGYADGSFKPNAPFSRAMLVSVLWRKAGSPVVNYAMDYSDVAQDAWYGDALRWAASEGLVSGYSDGSFKPSANISREQLATILYRYEQKINGGGFTGDWMFKLDFKDAAQISDYASEALHWCVMNKIISGKADGSLDPKGAATRGQVAAMLVRYIKLEK